MFAKLFSVALVLAAQQSRPAIRLLLPSTKTFYRFCRRIARPATARARSRPCPS